MEGDCPIAGGLRPCGSAGVAVRVRSTVAASAARGRQHSSKVEIEPIARTLFCSVLFRLEWKFEERLTDGSRCSSGPWSATSLLSR
jgi:hypothetical protein